MRDLSAAKTRAMATEATHLLVHYEKDDSFSVMSANSRNLVKRNGGFVKVNWPRQGIFDGRIIEESGMYV